MNTHVLTGIDRSAPHTKSGDGREYARRSFV
jgi:hypothetical protein